MSKKRDWQLYDMPERDRANKAFDNLLEHSFSALDNAFGEMLSRRTNLLTYYSDLGALDGETQQMFDHEIRRKIEKLLALLSD